MPQPPHEVITQGEAKEHVSEVRSGTWPIFAIFEGGGAKGIAHVGAYAAADEMRFEFVGVAGASAGAIVASLIAVGFKPNDIFNPGVQGENIFSAHNLSSRPARPWIKSRKKSGFKTSIREQFRGFAA